jgi:TonB family protein
MKKLTFSSLIAVILLSFCLNIAKAQSDDKIYSFVSLKNPPSYPDGMAAFYKFLGANIKYPSEAKANNVRGKVLVSFVVERDGSLADIKIERSLGYGTDEETVRVLKLSKKWNPGMLDGKAVKVKYNIPVSFALAGQTGSSATKTTSGAVTSNGDKTVYNFVSMESPPTYPGGMQAFYKFLGENIKYPTAAKDNKIQGKVLVSFIIEQDGSLTDIKVNRKLGFGTDEEAIRVLGLSKRWNPGLLNGKPVNVKYNVPIAFNLNK